MVPDKHWISLIEIFILLYECFVSQASSTINFIFLCMCSLLQDEKDKKIQELSAELRNKKRLCTTYQEQLTAFMKIVEEYNDQLSLKVRNVVNNLKEFESIDVELTQRG